MEANAGQPRTARQLRPRRTHASNKVLSLPGGNEDNDLWLEVAEDLDGDPVLASVFVPTDEQRQQIADGLNIELCVFGTMHPPVSVAVTDVPIGKAPDG
jgi:hypothetical protein